MTIVTPSPQLIQEAGKLLRAGGLVAFPTETVYGLGADATNEQAVAAVFALKQRPCTNPLIIHVSDMAQAEALGIFDARARYLARRLWPGALTLVLRQRPGGGLAALATAGLATVALRVPNHPVALSLLEAAQRPLAGPSANPSGRVSPTIAQHVEAAFGAQAPLILDGGACTIGVESTVVDLSGEQPCILRLGGVTAETITASLGEVPIADEHTPVKGPGMLSAHYAPRLPVRLGCEEPCAGEGLLAFGLTLPEGFAHIVNLSEAGNLAEAAANLYSGLRALDAIEGLTGIAVMPLPPRGLGLALMDRLRRAAAPRQA